jgi:hypothetical protein
MEQVACACLQDSMRQSFIDAHQEELQVVQEKLRLQLSSALLMITDACSKLCLEPLCTEAMLGAGDTDDRGEVGDQESAVDRFNKVVLSVKSFLQDVGGSQESPQVRQLKQQLGNSLQRAAISFLEDAVFSSFFEPKFQDSDAENLRRMCSLVLRSNRTEYLSRVKPPLLVDGSDDDRIQGITATHVVLSCFVLNTSFNHVPISCMPTELKSKAVQSMLQWSVEDAIANYDASKVAIESATASDGVFDAMSDDDLRSLGYLLDVFRFAVGAATAKQVFNLTSVLPSSFSFFSAQIQRRAHVQSGGGMRPAF